MKCEVKGCERYATWLIEPGVNVCGSHSTPQKKQWVCKFCFRPIQSPEHPVGHHDVACPRYDKEKQ